jgi:hypothetical protein
MEPIKIGISACLLGGYGYCSKEEQGAQCGYMMGAIMEIEGFL